MLKFIWRTFAPLALVFVWVALGTWLFIAYVFDPTFREGSIIVASVQAAAIFWFYGAIRDELLANIDILLYNSELLRSRTCH